MIIVIILAAVREEEEHWRASSWPPFSNLPMSKKKTGTPRDHSVTWLLFLANTSLVSTNECYRSHRGDLMYTKLVTWLVINRVIICLKGLLMTRDFFFKKKKRIKNRKCSYCFKEQQGDLFSWWLGEKATAGIQELAASNRNRHGGGCIYLYSVKKVLLSTCSCRSDLSNLRRGGQPQSEERRKGHVTRWIKSLLANWSLSAEIFFSFH